MKTSIKKFLEFNGKSIYFVNKEGQWWIAIKPICEALSIDYIRQYKNTKKDPILLQLLSKQTIVALDGRVRQMVCLPEFVIYGWIFGLKSSSYALQQYKMECYTVLFNHFHGTITMRQKHLIEMTKEQIEKQEIEARLSTNPDFIRLRELNQSKTHRFRELRKLDNNLVSEQMSLFS